MFVNGGMGGEELLGLDPASLDDEALAELLDRLDAHRNQVDAAFARCVGVVDTRGLWAKDGTLSAGAWLARRCALSGAEARSLVNTTRKLRSLPVTAEA
ncbi:MAG: DUF222 domain-containing protein, partial [Acidimicrobiia bacterium]|nr:DUF222 domain-containing protein [Acidimicrobiia bacterium]